eukprot:10325-Heterococcus_DN1.PRE.1
MLRSVTKGQQAQRTAVRAVIALLQDPGIRTTDIGYVRVYAVCMWSNSKHSKLKAYRDCCSMQ